MNVTHPPDVSTLLLLLYRLSHELPIQDFQDAALNLLKPVLHFDSSMWGTATTAVDGIDVHTLHLHQKSPEMMAEYESHKHLDSAAASFFGKGHGTRGFNSARWWSGPKYAPFLDFVQRYEQNNIFITMNSDPRTNFMQWVSLFRADADAHCKAEEERLLAELSPHLMQALALNRVMHLDRSNAPASVAQRRGAAIADLRGTLYHADGLFETALKTEWPSWKARTLPDALLKHFLQGHARYGGHGIVVTHHVAQRLLFLRSRKRCLADNLTAREHTIAELLAQGDTHKRVAEILSRSPATVRNHTQAIYEKLEVSNVAGLIQQLRLAD